VTDFDRQVRIKTHATHTSICLAAGKRFSKHLKTCIGPWVISLRDSDLQVSRAAVDSFRSIFDTERKYDIVWEKYSDDVLKYIFDILLNAKANTISKRDHHIIVLTAGDGRFMSAEDMDSRFSLIIGMCLASIPDVAGIISCTARSKNRKNDRE
jgi:hypothetical protein